MANPYTSPSLANYNANPPSDDVAQTNDNRITWNIHVRGKIGDPLRNYADSINTNILAAFGRIMFNGVSARAATFTVASTEQGTLFTTTNTITVNLPSAASVGSNFAISVQKADGGSTVATIDPDGTETVDGETTITLTRQFESVVLVSDGANWSTSGRLPRGLAVLNNFFDGFTISNSSGDPDHDIDVAPGQAADSNNTGLVALTASITKRIDASFTEGTASGGLDTGTVAADTRYHIHVISKTDGTADVIFSTSPTAPTLPVDFVTFRRIGEILTDSSANIIPNRFSQVTPTGEIKNASIDVSGGNTIETLLDNLTNVREIVLTFDGVGVNTTNPAAIIQLGTASAFATTGYTGGMVGQQGGSTQPDTNGSGFLFAGTTVFTSTEDIFGEIILRRKNDNDLWSMSGNFMESSTGRLYNSAGVVTLSDSCTRVRLTTEGGTITFDEGSVHALATMVR